jgi:methylase of polypeptide subunit release factors
MTEESFTKPELKEILDKRISSNSDSDEKTFKFRDREFVILRNVFSPTFFPNTHWYTNTFLDNMPHVASLLEIGTGAGNVLAEALLLKKCEWGVGSDITPEAVENAALNFKRFEINAEAVVSDVLDSLNKEWRFDLMYWNYPYHHDFGKQDYKDMSPIELSLRDPNYSHLDKLLATAKPFLKSTGFIIISFSFQMGNTHRLQ